MKRYLSYILRYVLILGIFIPHVKPLWAAETEVHTSEPAEASSTKAQHEATETEQPHEGEQEPEQAAQEQGGVEESQPEAPIKKERLKVTAPKLATGSAADVKQLSSNIVKAQAQKYIAEGNGKLTVEQLLDIWTQASIFINKNTALAGLIVRMLPKDLFTKFLSKDAGLTEATIMDGPYEFRGSFILKGNVHAPNNKKINEKIAVSLLYAPEVPSWDVDPSKKKTVKGGVSLSIGVPPNTPLSELFPTLNPKTLGSVQLSDVRCIISDCQYYDPVAYFPISKGLTAVVGINPANVGFLSSEKIKKVMEFEENATIYGTASIAPNEEEVPEGEKKKKVKTAFKIILPSQTLKFKEFKLSQVTELLHVPMPSNIQKELAQIVIKDLNIGIDLTQYREKFSLNGKATCFNTKNVDIAYKIFKAEMTSKNIEKAERKAEERAAQEGKEVGPLKTSTIVNNITFTMPDGWNVTRSFPQLKSFANLKIKTGSLTLTSQSYNDPQTYLAMPQGLTLTGTFDINDLKTGNSDALKTIENIVGKELFLSGVFATDLAASKFNVTFGKEQIAPVAPVDPVEPVAPVDPVAPPKKTTVSLGDLVPPVAIFNSTKESLSKYTFTIGEFNLQFGGSDVTKKGSIQGTTTISNKAIPTELQLILPGEADKKKLGALIGPGWHANLMVSIPQKIKGVCSELDAIDSVPLSSLRLALIQYPFYDSNKGIDYQRGINIGGYLGFTGDLAFMKKIIPVKDFNGVDINGVIGTGATKNIRLEASLPGAGITFDKKTKMESMRLVVTAGMYSSFGLEGTVSTEVPKQFRPKKSATGESLPMMIDLQALPIDLTREGETIAIDLDTLMDASESVADVSEEAEVDEGGIEAVATEDSTGELIISDAPSESPGEEAPIDTSDLETIAEDNPPYLGDIQEDTSGYAEPVGENNRLKFRGSINISGETGILSCSMEGVVDLMGVLLSNVGIMGQLNMLTITPSGFGLRASLEIQKGKTPKIMNFAAKAAAGATTTSFMWAGDFKGGLYLSDLVQLANKMVKHSPNSSKQFKDAFFGALKKVPKVGVDEISLSIVPESTDIAGTYYDQGMSGNCKFVLFGARGAAAIKMNYSGINGSGSLDKVVLPRKAKIPVFVLSSFDKKAGASFSFNIGAQSGITGALTNEFILDGNMEIPILGFKEAAKVSLSATGGTFELSNKPLFGLYQVDLSGTIPLTNPYDTKIKGRFKQDALHKFAKQLKDASYEFVEQSNKELHKARQDIHKEFDGKINAQREIVKKEREKGTKAISDADQKAKAAINKEIENTKKRIQTLKDRDRKYKKECKKAKIKSCGKIVSNGTELAAQEAYLHGLLKPGKQTAHGTLNAAKGAVNLTPIDSDPRVASLIAAKETALAGIKAGTGASKSLGEVGKAIAAMGDKAINLQLVEVDVHVQELVKGKLPKFTIKGIFFGKKIYLKNIQLDMKDASKAVKQVVAKVLDNIKF